MTHKVCFIVPYFGRLPKGFQTWLNSCKGNPEFDFLLFTDDNTEYLYPENVKVHYCTFADIKNKFQEKFDFPIMLERPYKLCDFRPAYGYVFADEIKQYDFWGHCDSDLIWGKISDFYTDELFEQYDHLGIWGHCQLFRNDEKTNRIFMNCDAEFEVDYKTVFTTDKNFGFDEVPINVIFSKYCEKNYFKMNFANLNKYDYSFHLVNYIPEEDYKNKHQVFEYKDGKILRHYVFENQIYTEEFCYLHLWCRPITFKIQNPASEHYFMYPEVVTDRELKLTVKNIKRKNRKNPIRYYCKSIWRNRKKLTWERIMFNIRGRLGYKKDNRA